LISPFAFLGLPLLSSEVFLMSAFTFFGVASFFIEGLFDEPLCIFWGCLFFYRRSFWGAPLHFLGLPLFFIGGLFDEPMNERYDSAPLFMAP
jgi:hypothetical protein